MTELHLTLENTAPPLQLAAPVYIVDSDGDVGRGIQFLLEAHSIPSTVFTEGELLLNRALVQPPSCIVADAVLPDISGVNLLKRLREHGLSIPVIFLANSTEVALVVEAVKSGAWDYFEKPFLQRVLLDSVRRALQHVHH